MSGDDDSPEEDLKYGSGVLTLEDMTLLTCTTCKHTMDKHFSLVGGGTLSPCKLCKCIKPSFSVDEFLALAKDVQDETAESLADQMPDGNDA